MTTSSAAGTRALELSSTNTRRFVAAHGRRSVVMGYPESCLEVWAYPLQIISGYQIGFLPEGATPETDGRMLLRVVERPAIFAMAAKLRVAATQLVERPRADAFDGSDAPQH